MQKDNQFYFGLVHDVLDIGRCQKDALKRMKMWKREQREVKEEIGLDMEIIEKLGENEYVATQSRERKDFKESVLFFGL